MSSSLGMKLSLPPEMAAKLRQYSQPEKVSDDSETQQQVQDENVEKVRNDKLPEIAIDVENLVGYKPEMEEMESIKSQLLDAMWTRYRLEEREDAPKDASTPTIAPPDFDFQVVELLQSGVARFKQCINDETSAKDDEGSLILSYPPAIITSDGESKSTIKLWQQSSKCPPAFQNRQGTEFIPRLWSHLAYCSRNLDWKYKMSQELANLVEEEEARIRYEEWTTSQRKAKLEQLYSIRETILHQVEMNKAKYDLFVKERDTIVKEKMQQQHRSEKAATSDLSFPEEFALLGMNDRATEEQEDDWGFGGDDDSYGASYGSDCSDNSERSDGGYGTDDSLSQQEEDQGVDGPIPIPEQLELPGTKGAEGIEAQQVSIDGEQKGLPEAATDGINANDGATGDQADAHVLSFPFKRRQERRERAKQRKKEAKRQAERERLKKLEQELVEKHTSREMVVAQTLYEALSKKLENVEELLESLQDEEWQAEEERENEAESKEATVYQREKSFTLLDQILAMILGTTPIPRGKTVQEHYRFVQEEHKFIVNEWKTYFGRLPASVGGTTEPAKPWPTPDPFAEERASPSELRMQLGIVDNSDDDWDVNDDIAAKDSASGKKEEVQPTKPKIYGLRPGGSLK